MSGISPENKVPSQQHNEKFQKQFDTYLKDPSTLREKLNDTSLNKALEEQLKNRDFATKMLYDVTEAMKKTGLKPEDKKSLETVKNMIDGKYSTMTDVENYKRTLKSQPPTGEAPSKTKEENIIKTKDEKEVKTTPNTVSELTIANINIKKFYSGVKKEDYIALFDAVRKNIKSLSPAQITAANEYIQALKYGDKYLHGANKDGQPGINTFRTICNKLGPIGADILKKVEARIYPVNVPTNTSSTKTDKTKPNPSSLPNQVISSHKVPGKTTDNITKTDTKPEEKKPGETGKYIKTESINKPTSDFKEVMKNNSEKFFKYKQNQINFINSYDFTKDSMFNTLSNAFTKIKITPNQINEIKRQLLSAVQGYNLLSMHKENPFFVGKMTGDLYFDTGFGDIKLISVSDKFLPGTPEEFHFGDNAGSKGFGINKLSDGLNSLTDTNKNSIRIDKESIKKFKEEQNIKIREQQENFGKK